MCRGFSQITITTPWRRMILHFSHMGLTDGRTFTAWFALYWRDIDCIPDGVALATVAVAATAPGSGTQREMIRYERNDRS